jgi:predicted Zn-dependent protease
VFEAFDTAAIARPLSQIAERPGDLVDAYFERREEIELPPPGEAAAPRVRREEGLAVRLAREGRTWLAAGDRIAPGAFARALRQVARALPAASYPEPPLASPAWEGPPAAPELARFVPAVEGAIRRRHVAFEARFTLRRHHRWLRVVGPRLVADDEEECFYSCLAETAWGRHGALLPALGAEEADQLAAAMVAAFRARQASPPAAGETVAVLAPAAAAVFLHEAVAHALEADVLALGGRPEAAVGVRLGAPCLNVLDDPGASPGRTRRRTDDEGVAVARRWLLRAGVVEQPLADSRWGQASGGLTPGAGRRGSRHLPPSPRSSHLELLAGEHSEEELLAGAEAGLFVPAASRGRLDPLSGRFTLWIPHARRIRQGVAADAVGPCRLGGTVAGLLAAVAGVGRDRATAGAGWCAKGGQKLPVWASTPALRLEGVEVRV